MNALKFNVADLIHEPDDYTSNERAQAASTVAELIEALQDCVDAQQPMAQMRATDRARAVLARVGSAT